jgi:5,10-methylenetetrahydromethanopterin reductase
VTGTILAPGEDSTTRRVRSAVGPAFVTSYHAVWRWNSEAVGEMPGGAAWRARIEAERPEGQRHLVVHEGHFVAVTDRDRPTIDAVGPALLQTGWTGDEVSFRDHLRHAGALGITEVIVTPAGGDVDHQLEAFAAAAADRPSQTPVR